MRKPDSTAERARPEAEVSQQRQEQAREQVTRPLEQLAAQNQFASIIRASLTEGRRRRT